MSRSDNGPCRGHFGIGIYHPNSEHNVGTLWRSAHLLGANYIFTIGRRYRPQSSDTSKAWHHLPLFHFSDFEALQESRPREALLVGIEMGGTHDLRSFVHPERAIYLLGAEDYGLPKEIQAECQAIVQIPDLAFSLNVSATGSIVMYDRVSKGDAR